ncbi:outer membrane protein with beta-barrel domain [Chitinophaga skermanii]|uniref:Outer membrane protein with beta-barrel domain n=1 Tax=Chitinophaga skermanii TaxID=331697 RepID=A0A327R0R2_9BACT|nr:DUF6089 family protein [Chitinophaga skermanii]RAJ10476.1 outer membrane protein with beta-barrel domain [Chitinophaga skermanii]
MNHINACFRRIIPLLTVWAALLFLGIGRVQAQYELKYVGEAGFAVGAAHYFGDLNTRTAVNAPKPVIGAFYKYYFSDYVGAKATLRFMQLGYSDAYNTNDFQRKRNLSFNTNLYELALQGDFNFFRFEPGSLDYAFTPYLTGGLAMFHFNPYAMLDGKKYFLQPLRTEGQGSPQYSDRKQYNLISHAYLIGGGFKYNYSKKINLAIEVLYRFSQTDYLDDVSTTYVGDSFFPPDVNGNPSVAYRLQDRSSAVTSPAIGEPGRQRGNSRDKDHYATIEFTVGWLFTSYKCKF